MQSEEERANHDHTPRKDGLVEDHTKQKQMREDNQQARQTDVVIPH